MPLRKPNGRNFALFPTRRNTNGRSHALVGGLRAAPCEGEAVRSCIVGCFALSPNIGFLSPVPVITVLIAALEWRALADDHEIVSFLGAIGLFLTSFIRIAISLWPMIVPYRYTL